MSSTSSLDEVNQADDNDVRCSYKRRKKYFRGEGKVPLTTRKRWLANNCGAEVPAGTLESTSDSSDNEESQQEPNAEVLEQDVTQDNEQMDRASSASSTSSASSVSSVSSTSVTFERRPGLSGSDGSENSSDDKEEHSDKPMNVPLFEGSKWNKGTAVSNLLDLCCKHAVSKSLMADLVEYTYNLLPRPNTFPQTLYFFEQDIHPFIPPHLCTTHYCCEKCGTYLGAETERKACVCNVPEEKSFYEFPLETQIKYLFEQRNLADVIDSYQDKVGNISDITTGEEYLKVKAKLTGKYDIVLLTSADGLRPHKNSSQEIWALTYTICEVPPSLRKAFTLVTQIWCGEKKPVMSAYMIPFARSLQNLYHVGVEWQHPRTKEHHTTKGTAPAHTLDAPARGMLQNITQHGGYCSCNICEVEGESIHYGKGKKVIYPFSEDLVLREKLAMEAQEDILLTTGEISKGVRGSSVLSSIPLCDRANSVIMDYMHLVLLGVTRLFFDVWINGFKKSSKKKRGEQGAWYIGHRAKVITDFLLSIKRIYEFTRFPKYVKKYKTFKASAWLVWLLFISVPALHHNLPQDYFQHWLLLVMAINLLLQEVISEDDIKMSDLLLSCFVEKAEMLYGKRIMNYNVHGLLHLPLMVKRWGGLWATSTFLFEGYNAVIIRSLHGTIHISQEFANVFARQTANVTLKNTLLTNEECASVPLVKGKAFHSQLNELELLLLQKFLPSAKQPLTLHARVQLGRTIYTSVSYTAEKATNNKIVCFKKNGDKAYGVISYFHKSEEVIFAFINVLGVDLDARFQHRETGLYVSHIIPIFYTEEMCVVPVQDIVCKVIKVGHYVCLPPNRFERNL